MPRTYVLEFSDHGILGEFRKYHVWQYSSKQAQHEPALDNTLSDRPLSELEKRRVEGAFAFTMEETT
eukprot:scaffold105543_cov30-Tisochrysis_lutea.AAC.2